MENYILCENYDGITLVRRTWIEIINKINHIIQIIYVQLYL